jgi:heptosyltransferase-2
MGQSMPAKTSSRIKSILVRSPNWIGDQILAFPFFHYLRKAYPKARIGVACVSWVEALQFRNLIDEVIPLEKPDGPGLMAKLRNLEESARAIREKGPWDMGIILPNSFSSAWMFFRAGVKERRGYNFDGRKFLLHDAIHWPIQSVEHRAQAYVNLLPEEKRPRRPVSEFWGIPAENELDEDVPGEIEFFNAARAWPDAEPLNPPQGNYWVLAPGSQAESRRWPIEKFVELARQIAQTTGWTGVVVGGLAESQLAESLCEDPELKLVDMTAQGPVPYLWKIFSGAKFSVCNDSGLAHVAALCGSPVQIVWGAGDPKRTLPMGPKKIQMIFQPTECWPCERNTCRLPPGRQMECLRGIQPDAVWKEIQSGIRL